MKNINIKDLITILIPCSLKPMHSGHLNLIQKYCSHPLVKKIRILVGPGVRDGITQDIALIIAKELTKNINKVFIEKVKTSSPVLTAFNIISNPKSPKGNYALVASSKGSDYKTVKDFTRKNSPGGRYYNNLAPGISVIEFAIDIDINPKLFKGRTDEYEGKPISSSVLRKDLLNGNFDNFMTGYPNIDLKYIIKIWEILEKFKFINQLKINSF